MKPKCSKTPIRVRFIAAGTCLAFLAGCATTTQTAGRLQYGPAPNTLREARSPKVPVKKRAADYVQVATMTDTLLGTGAQQTPAVNTYNAACGELTMLLRNSEGGRLWNHPLTLTADNKTYHLRLEPAGNAVWAPNYFTTFVGADQIKEKRIGRENIQEVVGARLVGVRGVIPLDKFAPRGELTARVMAALDFQAKVGTLPL